MCPSCVRCQSFSHLHFHIQFNKALVYFQKPQPALSQLRQYFVAYTNATIRINIAFWGRIFYFSSFPFFLKQGSSTLMYV